MKKTAIEMCEEAGLDQLDGLPSDWDKGDYVASIANIEALLAIYKEEVLDEIRARPTVWAINGELQKLTLPIHTSGQNTTMLQRLSNFRQFDTSIPLYTLPDKEKAK